MKATYKKPIVRVGILQPQTLVASSPVTLTVAFRPEEWEEDGEAD